MVVSAGTVSIPITATFNGKAIHIGDLVLEVKIVNGRVKTPTEREIKNALRRGLR